MGIVLEEDQGIIPRAIRQIFDEVFPNLLGPYSRTVPRGLWKP